MFRLAIQRPIAISMLFLALVMIGVLSYKRLAVDLLPSITYPRLTVVSTYEDIPAEDLERLVTRPLEEVVTALAGVRKVVSRTREGVSVITVEYEWGTEMDFANLHLRESLDRVAFRDDFPEEAGRPVILRWDPTSRPISVLVLEGEGPMEGLTDFAREVVKPALEQVEGISQAEVVGGADREIVVRPDPSRLAIYDVTIEDIRLALSRNNISFPGGKIRSGPLYLSLRISGEFEDLEQVAATEIPRPGRTPIRVADLAEVVDTVKEAEGFTLLGARPVVSVLLYKEPEANTIRTSEKVDVALEILGTDYGDFAHTFVYRDADYVRASFQGLVQSLLVGAGLAFFVLFFFLRDLRSPVVVGLSIPVSLAITFALFHFGKVKLNLMSLGGLSLAAGMLVDNAIVVLENINRHLSGRDRSPDRAQRRRETAAAAERGVTEMARPVMAATLTTVAVFFPVIYVPGIAGAFFRDQALAVTFSLLVSIAVALLLEPMLAARILTPGQEPRGVFRIFSALLESTYRAYHRVLVWSLARPRPLLFGLVLFLAVAGVAGSRLPRSLMPERSSGDLHIDLELPAGTPLEETADVVAGIADWLSGQPGVTWVFSQVGRTERTLASLRDYTAPNTARLRVVFGLDRGAHRKSLELEKAAAARLARLSGVTYVIREEGVGLSEILSSGEAPFSLGVVAEDARVAVEAAETLAARLADVPGLADLQVDRVLGTPNLVVRLDREEILRSGLDPQSISREVVNRVSGAVATTFNEVEQRIDIAVRLPRAERRDLAGLLTTPVEVQGGATVPLGTFLEVEEERPVRELVRRNQRRMVTLTGDVRGRSIDAVWKDAELAVAASPLPAGVMVVPAGERSSMQKSFQDLGWAMLLAALLVYMILAAQFESFLDPLLIASVLPIGMAGAAAAILITGNSVNILSLIGAVALLGIAVNDAIVKLDTIRRLREEGVGGRAAILEASRLRFRPILMTSATTVLAMVPMAIGLGSGEQLQRPLAITIIGGLTLTTALTLLYTPILYQFAHRLGDGPLTEDEGHEDSRGMTRFFLRHPVTTWMIFTGFLVLGIYALPKLRLEAIPDVNLPTLTVTTQWPGASPQAIHRSITLPVEEAARRVPGVEEISSTSRSGESRVEVSFRRGTDVEFARLDLNEQMGAVRRALPLGAGQPQISIFVPEEFETDDFFTLSLESPLGANELREEAETWIVPRLLAVEGVADVRVQGGARPLLRFVLDRKRLERHDLTADEVFLALDAVDDLAGAGVIEETGTEKLVALREPVDLELLRHTAVARRGGRTFTLEMLGDVEKGYEDPEYVVRANGQNVVQVQIEKRSGANTVGVSGAIRNALPGIQATLPFDASFHIDEDQGEDLREKLVDLVRRSLVILAFLFLLLALSLRQVKLTAIVICSIVFAVLISLSLFYFFHISVNFITLSGLTVCFGMILDNSILVLDAIHRRLAALSRAEAAGLSRRAKLLVAMETIREGSREVAFPILATTLTTVVAFVSFIFLTGRLALYYIPLAVSVATAMIASLFVAFGWIPVALNQFWAAPLVRKTPDGPRNETDGRALHDFVEEAPDLYTPLSRFERLVGWSLRIAPVIVLLSLGLVAWSFGVVYRTKVDKGGFFQLPDQEELLLYLELPAGTDLLLTSETLASFEEVLLPIPEGARMLAVTFGGNRAFIRIEFEDELLRTEIPTMYRMRLVEAADVTGGASVFIRGFAERPYFKGPFTGSGLNSLVKLTGYNSKRLGEIAETALHRLERNRRVRNPRITSGQRFDRAFTDETVLTIQRDRLAEHGISVVELVGYVRRLLGVDFPWSLQVDGKRERAQLSFSDADQIQMEEVAGTVIRTPRGEKVRLGDLVGIETRPMKGSVMRENQRYTMFLNWEFVGPDRMRRGYIKTVIAGMDLPYGYGAEEATQEFFTEEEEEELALMAVLAVIFIFMLMAALFESVSLPLLVLLSIPFALSGVFLAFWLTHATFDSSGRIGLVLLFGIVVNNAILLASRFRTEAALILRGKQGGDPEGEAALFPGMRKTLGGSDLWRLPAAERPALLRRAVARAVRVRLRSILLTSGTTVAGLAPLLIHFRETEGRDIWENLALTSIGGLVSSTVLILVALPATYYLAVRGKWVVLRFLGWLEGAVRRLRNGPLPDTPPRIS